MWYDDLRIIFGEEIKKLKELPLRPASIKLFEDLAIQTLEGKLFKQKIVGIFCLFPPIEFIYAAGLIPVRLCSGVYEAIPFSEDILPRDCCPLVKSSIGILKKKILPFMDRLSLLIIPTTCDWKMKMSEVLDEEIPIWILNLPHQKEKEHLKKAWFKELEELIKELEKIGGKRITRWRLRESIVMVRKAQKLFRRLYELKKKKHIYGSDMVLIFTTFFYSPLPNWMEKMEEFLKEAETLDLKGNPPRILLTGSPIIFPNLKLPYLIESSGGLVVADEFCTVTRILYDPVVMDEFTSRDLFEAVAERYLLPCTCPCFTPNEEREKRLLELCESFDVEGVIYHVYKGCFIYDMELFRIQQLLKKKDIPLLRIETDYTPEDIEQIRTRVEAFLEMLKERR